MALFESTEGEQERIESNDIKRLPHAYFVTTDWQRM